MGLGGSWIQEDGVWTSRGAPQAVILHLQLLGWTAVVSVQVCLVSIQIQTSSSNFLNVFVCKSSVMECQLY